MIGSMVGDVLAETERRVREAGVETAQDVRGAGKCLVGFSAGLGAQERELKRFLYSRLYESLELEAVRKEAVGVVSRLADAYRADPALLPTSWQHEGSEIDRLRTIGDFIAGMTDRFAIRRHEELVGPVELASDRF